MDKTKIYEILSDWNFWNNKLPIFIERKKYASLLEKYEASEEIIALIGIRRCGKSTLLLNYIENLVREGIDLKQILFINFEDPRFGTSLDADLLDEIFATYKEYVNNEKIPFVFLDEIQNVSRWEKWVRTKHELKHAKIFVTGSSSKLLSKEFGTALSGRYLPMNVFPLSFKEYLIFKNELIVDKNTLITNKIKYKQLFNHFIKEGGFPKVVLLPEELKRNELLAYYDTIILKDIVARYNLKNYDNVKKVSLYIFSNIGKPLNLNNIRKAVNISYELVEKYFEYLLDTFLFFEITKYDYSLKKQLSGQKKIYCVDTGMLEVVSFKFSEDYGRFLENLVFIELKRKGLEIYYHLDKRECDFLIKEKDNIVQAIQVTRNMEDLATKKREIEGLIEAMKVHNLKLGFILTEDEEYELNENGLRIIVLPVWKWLLLN